MSTFFEKVLPVTLEDEMKSSYIDYSMSVIVSRALPDVRDGLKPVHRRVLYGMHELGLANNKAYKNNVPFILQNFGSLISLPGTLNSMTFSHITASLDFQTKSFASELPR